VVAIGNFRLQAFDVEIIEVFWIPCQVAWVMGMSRGMLDLASLGRWVAGVVLGAAAIGLGWQTYVSAKAWLPLRQPLGYWHGRNLLTNADPSAWFFVAAEDNDVFPVAYAVWVERVGRAERIMDDLGCVITRAYGDDFKWLNPTEQALRMKAVQERILKSGEPADYTLAAHLGNVILELPDQGSVPLGLLYRVVRVSKGWEGGVLARSLEDWTAATRPEAGMAWRRLAPLGGETVERMVAWDVFSRTVVARYAYMRLEHDLASGRGSAPAWEWKTALLGYDVSWLHNALGNALGRHGLKEAAKLAYRRVIALEPKRAEPHTNLGGILLDEGRYDEAIE